jgi:hypothetical protein
MVPVQKDEGLFVDDNEKSVDELTGNGSNLSMARWKVFCRVVRCRMMNDEY